MLSSRDFINQSLELHLFFARIMKEHTLFLELSFTPRDSIYKDQASIFRSEFTRLLSEVVFLSNGIVRPFVLQSGEVVTPYTLNAEMVTTYLTGVEIPTELTELEYNLVGSENFSIAPMLEQKIYLINQNAIDLILAFNQFKYKILSNVLSCQMFTSNYPLFIEHIIRETEIYFSKVTRLQNREQIYIDEELNQEAEWNDIMSEHSKFIRGLLDPTEENLIDTANYFAKEFDELKEAAFDALDSMTPKDQLTEDSLNTTIELSNFKAQGTKGILSCQIKTIITPLLSDHFLREAYHYIRLLKMM